RPVVAAGALAVAALASCSLTTSLDGLTSEGATTTDAGDGSTKLDEGGKTLLDGAVPDVAVEGEGGPQAAFCVREPGHLLCSDFESGSVLDGKWDGTSINGTSTLTREEGSAASGRGNLVSNTSAISTAETHAVLVKNYTQTMKSLTFAASIKIVDCTPTGTGQASLLSVSAGPATDKWITSILVTPSGTVFNATKCPSGTCTGSNGTLAVAPPANTWSRVVMTIDLQATTATVTVDGKLALDKLKIAITAQNASANLNVGSSVRAPSGACRIEYDDVTFDIQ
ncbi:MAG: hypothetical protein JWM74_2864, partial [Myxococcaceae bacterium]|nr:hypothetical protein [Myxococcaceae bacterium]